MKLDYINEENKFNEDEFEELTEDEIYLNKGADAYQAGDYETAIRLYQKSARYGKYNRTEQSWLLLLLRKKLSC